MTTEFPPTEHFDRRAPVNEPWHLKKEVPIAVILALAVHIIVVVIYVIRIEGRVDMLAERQNMEFNSLHAADTRITTDLQGMVTELKEGIKELNRKMDRINERGMK